VPEYLPCGLLGVFRIYFEEHGRRRDSTAHAVDAAADAPAFAGSEACTLTGSNAAARARSDAAARPRSIRGRADLGEGVAPDRHIVIRQLDVGRTDQRRFISNLGLGLLPPRLVYETAWRELGRLPLALPAMGTGRHHHRRLHRLGLGLASGIYGAMSGATRCATSFIFTWTVLFEAL